MDFKEIKENWKNYDKKLDRIEISNQKIMELLITQKSIRKIQLISLQSLFGIIVTPLVLSFVLIPIALNDSEKITAIVGLVITIILFAVSFAAGIVFFIKSRTIKPSYDSVLKTKEKLLKLQTYGIKIHHIRNLSFPLIAASLILIFWDKLNYTTEVKILIFGLIVIAQFFWGKFKFKMYFADRMKVLLKETEELAQYKD